MPRLRIETGKNAGKSYDVAKQAIIGRGDTAQVQISDTHASREHCKVFEQGGSWAVADLNSRNGIKVNGVQTTRKNLAHGDKIAIGETVIAFETIGAPAAKKDSGPSAKAGGAKAEKEAAFAAARAKAAGPGRRAVAAPAAKPSGGDGGLKVSDRVLQFSKVDAKTATVLDIDLAQSPGVSRALVWLGCLLFLGLVVWGVSKMMS